MQLTIVRPLQTIRCRTKGDTASWKRVAVVATVVRGSHGDNPRTRNIRKFDRPVMRLGEVAKDFGISRLTVRKWQDGGTLEADHAHYPAFGPSRRRDRKYE
jgi:hypothetical protein